jgi:ABC-type protease/lipase transport system fused ATPase/permease subunit
MLHLRELFVTRPSMIPKWTFSLHISSYLGYARVRQYSSSQFPIQQCNPPASQPIVSIENSSVYRLGASPSKSAPLLREFGLVINEGESWAVVGTSGAGKDALLQVSVFESRSFKPC